MWIGALKIGLVRVAVRAFSTVEPQDGMQFRQLHADCQTAIVQVLWCPHCERQLTRADIIMGCHVERGRYVILAADDFTRAYREAPSDAIDIEQVVKAADIQPLHTDRSYYLVPEHTIADAEGFAVIREAIRGRAGIGKLALYGRERIVAVQALEQIMLLTTLHSVSDSRDVPSVLRERAIPTRPNRNQVRLARELLDRLAGSLHLELRTDRYASALRRVIDSKLRGEEIVADSLTEQYPELAKVTLTEALQMSL